MGKKKLFDIDVRESIIFTGMGTATNPKRVDKSTLIVPFKVDSSTGKRRKTPKKRN